jgi:hypothetical protein
MLNRYVLVVAAVCLSVAVVSIWSPRGVVAQQPTLVLGRDAGPPVVNRPFSVDTIGRVNIATQQLFNACPLQAAITLTAAGNTEIIPLSGSTTIRICHLSLGAAAAEDIKITRGTGANCAAATADVTGLYRAVTSLALDFEPFAALKGAAGTAICINQSGIVNAGGVVVYAQF